MSGTDNFFSRWSRRKQDVARESAAEKTAVLPVQEGDGTDADTEKASLDLPENPFDPASLEVPLPDLADITAGSDVSAFFQKGVPENLKNDALRKLWVVDPSIRDFVDPALDYAYDWNTPGGAPGFGPLSALDIARVAQMHLGIGEGAPTPHATPTLETKQRSERPVEDTQGSFDAPAPAQVVVTSPVRLSNADDGFISDAEVTSTNTPDLLPSEIDNDVENNVPHGNVEQLSSTHAAPGMGVRSAEAALPSGRKRHGGALPQ